MAKKPSLTTIQISTELAKELKHAKLFGSESYEDVIWDLLEDRMELSAETLKNIREAEADIRAGRVKSLEQVKKELGL